MMPPSAPPLASPPAETKLWQLGIGLIVFGCMSSSIGLLLMKRSTDVEDTLPLYKRWRWLLGFLFLVVNATIIDLIAYGITPLSLIAPFAGLTMVTNVPFYSFKDMHMKKSVPFATLVLVALGIAAVNIDPPIVVFGLFVVYGLSGYVIYIWRKAKGQPTSMISTSTDEPEERGLHQ